MYNYQGAIQAGANPSDVGSYLSKQTGYNFQGAVSAGANVNDVLKYMSTLPTKTETPTPVAPSPLQQNATEAGKNLVTDTNSHAANIVQDLSEKPSFTGAGDVIGNIAGEVGDFFGEGLKAIAKTALTPRAVQELKTTAQQAAGTPAAKQVMSAWNNFQAQHPDLAKNIGNAINIGALFGGEAISPTVEEATNAVKSGASTVAGVGSDIAESTKNAATDISGSIKNVIGKTVNPESSLEDTLKVVKPKLSATEEAAAKAAGRGQTSGILKTTTITPTKTELEMAKYAQEAGVKSSNSFDQNIQLMKDAQAQSAQKLRSGLQDSKAIWNQNDVKSVLSKVEKPLTIKSDTTLSRLANNFQKAALDISKNTPKNAEGILDMRQSLDKLIDKEFPSNIYSKDTPIGQYVRNTRQALNDFAESKLPDGKLPDGSTFKGELRRQSLLYNAIDNVSETAPKQGTNIVTRTAQQIKDHPIMSTAAAVGADKILKSTTGIGF